MNLSHDISRSQHCLAIAEEDSDSLYGVGKTHHFISREWDYLPVEYNHLTRDEAMTKVQEIVGHDKFLYRITDEVALFWTSWIFEGFYNDFGLCSMKSGNTVVRSNEGRVTNIEIIGPKHIVIWVSLWMDNDTWKLARYECNWN